MSVTRELTQNTVPDLDLPIELGKLPFNITLLKPDFYNLNFVRPVTSLDIYEGATTNFHPDGLFSVEIFGRVGSEERANRPSYIDVKLPIMHPFVYKALITLRAMYGDILSGKVYAKWDPALKDFTKANELDGETGYAFFMQHFNELELKKNKSTSRNFRIDMIEKYRELDSIMMTKVLVTPAGMRDLEIKNERVSKDEVNDLYYRLLAIANTITKDYDDSTISVYDTPRFTLQTVFNDIYQYHENMCTGKKGLIQSKWGSRRVFNGTRNVITAMDTSTADLDSPRTPSPLHTQIGLNQVINGALPLTVHLLKNGWLAEVFAENDYAAMLVNKETMQREHVELKVEEVDKWTTVEGLEAVVKSYDEVEIRQRPIEIAGHWLGLIYIDDDSFRIFGDITELPEGLSKDNVHPLTLTHLMYLSGWDRWNELISMNTRYPVAGLGSTYTTYVYCRTTIVASQKWPRGFDWEIDRSTDGALEFPISDRDAPFVDSMIPHTSYLDGLTADFDGDTMSSIIIVIQKAIDENRKAFHERKYWVGITGDLNITPDSLTVALTLSNMTS